MSGEKKQFVSEACHYYDRNRNPVYEVAKKDGKGTTPTTIKHAREQGLLPSVTTILASIAKPAITNWMINQYLIAVKENSLLAAHCADYEVFKDEITKIVEPRLSAGSTAGTEIHAAIGSLFLPAEIDEKYRAIVANVSNMLTNDYGGEYEWQYENVFVNIEKGYAGKIDLLITTSEGKKVLIDFKTTGGDNFKYAVKKPHDEYGMQAFAYDAGIDFKADEVCNIIINRDTGETAKYIYQKAERERYVRMFDSLLEFWKLKNDYRPENFLAVLNKEGKICTEK